MTTGGKTSGICTTASSSDFPQNDPRASSKAMAMPNGNATTVETAATRSDSATAVQSWGDRSNTRLDTAYDTGLIRKLKPYFSKIALAVGVRRKLKYCPTPALFAAAVAATGYVTGG